MIREHWREFGFWPWWWRTRVPSAVKMWGAVAVVLLGLTVYVVSTGFGRTTELPLRELGTGIPSGVILSSEFERQVRDANLYERWKRANPGEAQRYERFAENVKLGRPAEPPTLQTPLGRALVAATSLTSRTGSNSRP